MKLPPMVDMRREAKDVEDYFPSPEDAPLYPSGLCLYLCQDELDKLGLDPSDLSIGDMVHIFGMAIVTSKNESQTVGGENSCNVSLQVTHLAGEDEDEENEEADEEDETPRLYRK